MKKAIQSIVISVVIIFGYFIVPIMSAQIVEPAGCFSNGVCEKSEALLRCPDCIGPPDGLEGSESESEAEYKFTPPQDTGVTLPAVSQGPVLPPVAEEPFSFTPFILLIVFIVIGIVVGYILLRGRNTDIPQQ